MRLRIFWNAQSGTKRQVARGQKLVEVHRQESLRDFARSSSNEAKDWIWRISCNSIDDAENALSIDESPTWSTTGGTPPNWVVLEPTHLSGSMINESDQIDLSLEYLRRVLPIGAEFVETYPTIGNPETYGRTNAHGNPLNPHVAGVCHNFPFYSINTLAALLDVYLPTRLALKVTDALNVQQSLNSSTSAASEDDWEAVLENTDLLLHEGNLSVKKQWVYGRLWEYQKASHCQETYAICQSAQEADELFEWYESILG